MQAARGCELKQKEKEMKATFQNGNREVTVTATKGRTWEKDGMVRAYYDLVFDGAKLAPIDSVYEILSGETRDEKITIGGRTFGYKLGICCDSKTKRAAAAQAVAEIVAQAYE